MNTTLPAPQTPEDVVLAEQAAKQSPRQRHRDPAHGHLHMPKAHLGYGAGDIQPDGRRHTEIEGNTSADLRVQAEFEAE